MDDGRLGLVRRHARRNRRMTYVMNEIIRNRQAMNESWLTRHEHKVKARMSTETVLARQAAVRQRVLLHCMDVRKQATSSQTNNLGRYAGQTLQDIHRETEERIAWYHPSLRRRRLVERTRDRCLMQGEILQESDVRDRMGQFFQDLQDDMKRHAQTRRPAPPPNRARYRRVGGLLVGEDDGPRDGDFPDPFGTVKKYLEDNPLGRLAGLIPSRFKAELLRAQEAEKNGGAVPELADGTTRPGTTVSSKGGGRLTNLSTDSDTAVLPRMKNLSPVTATASPTRLERIRTLVLPPIQPTKQMVADLHQ
ncbi:uncharacterized protein LOC131955542 [Physella acuta]|uniref:uncharacterized protein LOC131955542 n=1 Tax=Physella acuta TaxID=109671 RepID=UPI0027DAC8E9|nr:uncharacterized protein LOC131955542 [Physella acuta]